MVGKAILASLAAILAVTNADGLYTKKSPVLQVDAKNYDSLIAKSNHTSIVEFYAPWCGHCQNLKPAYEKAAKNLAGLAKVAAVNCDDESNKAFCGNMGVQGFPTLKIVRPTSKSGKPVVEDYQGARTAKAIVDTIVDKIPNHVKRVKDSDLDEWLAQGSDTAKAILFTEKGTTSALLRALAVDFLSSISFAQIRNKETAAVEKFSITSFPTLLLLPGGDKEALVYQGEMKKDELVAFLKQVAEPNPDPAPKKTKASKKPKPAKSSSSASSRFSKASASHQSSEASEAAASATKMTVEDPAQTEFPDPLVETEKPLQVPLTPPPLQELVTANDLAISCLGEKTGTCVLLLLPPVSESEGLLSESASTAYASLSELAEKHHKRNAHLFPIYSVPESNEASATLKKALDISGSDVKVIAVNARRGWWRSYTSEDLSVSSLESWIDSIRLGEGEKEKLPQGVVIAEISQDGGHDEL
ncbi:putative pdi related protein a [Phaeomoniella chlamydospora]|uniref:protein disulfide-isomerase n=1 Tax=Phaeomoniella chlamydospora TaxID=158046 RepID=A0A0G2EHM8_PHACM|nr:putative pdi related protein a [Phaeomoniella chlamydospora]